MANGKTLLIWEEVPETTKVFVLDSDSQAADLARQSAGKFINSNDVEEGDPIELLSEWIGANSPTDIGIEAPISGPFDQVIVCGFLM